MDLLAAPGYKGYGANLRSRGDGPTGRWVLLAAYRKPPLTRRWTLNCLDNSFVSSQTSAHAEMDPSGHRLSLTVPANLRSRGDGPRACFCPTTRSAKPPLTRRWTRSNNVPDRVALQTSAHAEMDPRWARRSPARWPNLRSRGDGPISVMMYLTWFTKPPLTRRWTPTH